MKIQNMSESAEGWQPSREEVAGFLNTLPLGVVSTINEAGQPQSATVAFSETSNLELIIGTSESSRKAHNMSHNPKVAFNVTDPERRYTVQFEGLAEKLGKAAFDTFADNHFAKLPASAPFRDVEGQYYFLLRPTYVRFSDCNPYPWVLTEFTDFGN